MGQGTNEKADLSKIIALTYFFMYGQCNFSK